MGLEVGNIDLDSPTAAAVKDDTLYIVEKGGSAIIAADKNSGAQRSSSLTLSAEQNRGIAVYGSELVVSSPGSKIITRYDLSFNQIEPINTPVRLYRLDYMSDGKLLGCGSTVQTQDSVVYQFSPDFSDYTIVPPPSDSSIKSPYAAVTDSAGNYYIASHGDDKVQIYNRNYVYQFSITHAINAPLDIAYNNGLLYVLNSDKTIQIFNTSGTYLNTYNIDFAANPMRFDVISATQLVVVDASSLYFVNLDGSTVTPYQKTHASATFPRDVTIHNGKIYYLCNLKGDILVYNSDGVLLNYGAVSGYSYHPTTAVSIAATEDGTLYVCDEDNASLYRYDNSLNDIARYPLSSYGVSSPYSLFGYEQDILVCQPINNEIGIFSASAYTGGFIIKVDGDVISDFSSDVFSYDFKVTADTEHVDLGCVVSGGYTASGSIGRYLLDYGLNTFNIKVTNDGDTDTYKLYVTRAYPDGFLPTEETIDAFIAYTAASEDALPPPAEKKKVSSIRLELNFKNMNPDAVEIMPMSKHVNAVLRGNELTISWDEAGIDTSPSVLLSSSDSFGGLDELAVKEMIKQRRNLFIILASLVGAAVIFFMHFFTLYLRSHPGKRQYLKHKFKNK